jgi:hypothetical protein
MKELRAKNRRPVLLNFYLRVFLVGVCVLNLVAAGSCGRHNDDEPAPEAPPPANDKKSDDQVLQIKPTPVVVIPPKATPTPVPTPKAFWVASSTKAVLSYHGNDGQFKNKIDLSAGLNSGGITSLQLLDANTLVAFVDRGNSGEKLITINIKEAKIQNADWFQSAFQFLNNTESFSLMSGLATGQFLVQKSTGIENLDYTDGTNFATRHNGTASESWIPQGLPGDSTCSTGVIKASQLLYFKDQPLLLNLTSPNPDAPEGQTRLDVIGNLKTTPRCFSSFNFASDASLASDIPVGAVQMPDGFVYVLFQSLSNEHKIVKYSFDGVSLSAGTVIAKGSSPFPGTPLGITQFAHDSLAVGLPSLSKIVHISTSGEYRGVLTSHSDLSGISSLLSVP